MARVTIPGKKMMKMLDPEGGIRRGQDLIFLYQDEPYGALLTVVDALESVREEGARFGVALRDIGKTGSPFMFYGAVLTDIRDFLKLRFRAKGLTKNEAKISERIEKGIQARKIKRALSGIKKELAFEYLVNYAITALDKISKELRSNYSIKDLWDHIDMLIALLEETTELLYPSYYNSYKKLKKEIKERENL